MLEVRRATVDMMIHELAVYSIQKTALVTMLAMKIATCIPSTLFLIQSLFKHTLSS